MLLGSRIINYDIFDDDSFGCLMEDYKEGTRLTRLTAMIGRNQTGKTSFIDCLNFIKDSVRRNVTEASTNHGRPGFSKLVLDSSKEASFKLFFKLPSIDEEHKYILTQYELSIKANIYGSPEVSSEALFMLCKKEDGSYSKKAIMEVNGGQGFAIGKTGKDEIELEDKAITALGTWGKIKNYPVICSTYREMMRWFFCRFSAENKSTYYADGNAPGAHKHLNSDGTNVGNFLLYLKSLDFKKYNDLVSDIKSKIPTMRSGAKLPETVESSPDRLFLYLLLFNDPEPYSTIFIETPDRDLYHDMVDVLSTAMRQFSLKRGLSQIVFSTHNPYIVEAMSPNEIWVFKRSFEQENGDVTISCVGNNKTVKELSNEGIGMGAIWYGGYLD